MILIINTAVKDFLEIILAKDRESFKVRKKSAHYQESEKLLKEVESFLKQNKLSPKKLKGIGVVAGPGGFTSLRIGVVTANTLAYALGVPVVGVRLNEFDNNSELVVRVQDRLKKAKKGSQVSPVYDKEPNITQPK